VTSRQSESYKSGGICVTSWQDEHSKPASVPCLFEQLPRESQKFIQVVLNDVERDRELKRLVIVHR
jgi:hypothetical protein